MFDCNYSVSVVIAIHFLALAQNLVSESTVPLATTFPMAGTHTASANPIHSSIPFTKDVSFCGQNSWPQTTISSNEASSFRMFVTLISSSPRSCSISSTGAKHTFCTSSYSLLALSSKVCPAFRTTNPTHPVPISLSLNVVSQPMCTRHEPLYPFWRPTTLPFSFLPRK